MAYYRKPRRVRTTRRGNSNRRSPIWVRSNVGNPSIANNTTGAYDLLHPNFIDQGSKPGRTVVRVRGEVQWQFTGIAAASKLYLGGAVMGPDDSAVIDPETDANDVDWFFYEVASAARIWGTISGTSVVTLALPFDSKAARRIQSPLASVFMFVKPVQTDVATTSAAITVSASTLLK